MKFTCNFCGFSGKIGIDDSAILAFMWYKDQNNFNHTGIACTKCGTIHDCLINMIKIPLSVLRISHPYKTITYMTPMDLGLLVKDAMDKYSINCRESALFELQINEHILDQLTSLDLLGQCFTAPVTMTYSDFVKIKDDSIAKELRSQLKK